MMALLRLVTLAAVAGLLCQSAEGSPEEGATVPQLDEQEQAAVTPAAVTPAAAEVLLEVICSVSNETACGMVTESLELALEAIFASELGVPGELITVTTTCDKDARGNGMNQVVADVLVQIPIDVSSNLSAYNLSTVEEMIGNGTNQSNPNDYHSLTVQVIALNVAARGTMISPESLDDMLQSELASIPKLVGQVTVETVSNPTVVLKTTATSSTSTGSTTTMTSTSVSSSQTSTSVSTTTSTSWTSSSSSTSLRGAAVPTGDSVLSFTVLMSIQGNANQTDAEAAEAFRADNEAIEALRNQYAANVSVPPSAVEVNITVLTTSGNAARRRMASASANIQIGFRVVVPTESASRVEGGTKALSVNGFQDLVNTAVAASTSPQTYAAVVDSVEDIVVIIILGTGSTTSSSTLSTTTSGTYLRSSDDGKRAAGGISSAVILMIMTVAAMDLP